MEQLGACLGFILPQLGGVAHRLGLLFSRIVQIEGVAFGVSASAKICDGNKFRVRTVLFVFYMGRRVKKQIQAMDQFFGNNVPERYPNVPQNPRLARQLERAGSAHDANPWLIQYLICDRLDALVDAVDVALKWHFIT